MSGIIIKNTAIHHPKDLVRNEELVTEFKEYGKDIKHLLEAIGRKERYIDKSGEETSVTMAISATKKLLEKEGLRGDDIDVLVFSSGTPEYTLPANAFFIHQAIEGKNECTVYDMNANCVGGVLAIEQVIRTMLSNPKLKRAIVVASEQMSQYSKRDDEINRGVFGDGACAVLIERISDDKRGFIDSAFYTDSSTVDHMLFPSVGLSKAVKEETPYEDRLIKMIPTYQALRLAPVAKNQIEEMLLAHGRSKSEVKHYFITQVSVKAKEVFSQLLEEDPNKFVYVGDRFGYTGTSSPLFALHQAFNEDMLKEGDLFVLWSVGAGQMCCGTLYVR